MTRQTILFIGPQGSGKGTQARNLITYLQEAQSDTEILNIETGKLFRELREQEGETAKRVRKLLDEGQPIPDMVTNAFVMEQFLTRYTAHSHITLDGFPRNEAQATYLDELLAFYDRAHMTVIYLRAPEDVVKERLLSRGRFDDTHENIEERLRWSMQMMEGMVAYYKKRENTHFVEIDATQSIEGVFATIVENLE